MFKYFSTLCVNGFILWEYKDLIITKYVTLLYFSCKVL